MPVTEKQSEQVEHRQVHFFRSSHWWTVPKLSEGAEPRKSQLFAAYFAAALPAPASPLRVQVYPSIKRARAPAQSHIHSHQPQPGKPSSAAHRLTASASRRLAISGRRAGNGASSSSKNRPATHMKGCKVSLRERRCTFF